MTVMTTCQKCGKRLWARDQFAGKAVRCPDCQTISRLPARPERATADADVGPGVCPVCEFDLAIDPDQVADSKGRRYHRACWEAIKAQRKARRAGKTPAPTPPRRVQHVSEPEETPLSETLPAMSGAGWDGLPVAPATRSAGPFVARRRSSRSQPTWLYVLMGIGAAVPVALLLFVVLDWILASGAKPGPVASAPAATSGPAQSEDSDDRNGASPPAETSHPDVHTRAERLSQGPPPPLFEMDSSREDPFWLGPRYNPPLPFLIVVFLLSVALGAVMFVVACNALKETCEFPRAMAIIFVVLLPDTIVRATIGRAETLEGAALLLLMNLAWLVVVTWVGLRTSPAKALAIGVIYFLIAFLFFFSIAFVIGVVAGAIAHLGHNPI